MNRTSKMSDGCKRILRCSMKKDLRPATLLKKRLWHRRFPMKFAKFLRTDNLLHQHGKRNFEPTTHHSSSVQLKLN